MLLNFESHRSTQLKQVNMAFSTDVLVMVKYGLLITDLSPQEQQAIKPVPSHLLFSADTDAKYRYIQQQTKPIINSRIKSTYRTRGFDIIMVQAILQEIASFLSNSDWRKIILVNRQIFVWMHEPVRLLNLTVIQYDNYDAMKIGRFTRLEYIAINAPKFNNCRQVQALPTDHFKYLTAVELNGDGKAFKQGELVWIDLFRVMRTDKIHSLTLINMGRPHTLQSVGARTMTYIISHFPNLKELTIADNISILDTPQKCHEYLLKNTNVKNIEKLHIGYNIHLTLASCLLQVARRSVKDLTFYDPNEWVLYKWKPDNTLETLKEVFIKTPTAANTNLILNAAKVIESLHLEGIDYNPGQYSAFEQEDILAKLLWEHPSLSRIYIKCNKVNSIKRIIEQMTNAFADKDQTEGTKHINITIRCNAIYRNKQCSISLLAWLGDCAVKAAPVNDSIQISFQTHDVHYKHGVPNQKYFEKLKHDEICRICYQVGTEDAPLIFCTSCPSAYHMDCIRPRPKKEWLRKVVWACPSCSPMYQRIPLKDKTTGAIYPHFKEPLYGDLQEFLKKDHNKHLVVNKTPLAHLLVAPYLFTEENSIKGMKFKCTLSKRQ